MPLSIHSRDNDKVKWAARLVTQSRFRRETGLFVLEGVRLCADALFTGLIPQAVFYTPGRAQELGELPAACEQFEVTEAVFAKISDTCSPQGVLCVMRRTPPLPFDPRPGQRFLLLDRLQDPANLGAAARTAEALAIAGLIVTGDGCDVYSPKAQRAAMGALLRLPVWVTPTPEEPIAALRAAGLPVWAAVPDRGAVAVTAVDFAAGGAVCVGNEGAGLSPAVIAACDGALTIPMPGRAESLNAAAAAAILLWEMTRGVEA